MRIQGVSPCPKNYPKNFSNNLMQKPVGQNPARVPAALSYAENNLKAQNFSYTPQNFGLNFTRKLEEHRSWGASIDPKTKDVTFKIFAYPDSKSVFVKILDRDNPDNYRIFPLVSRKNDGVFETYAPIKQTEARAGDKYSFLITKADGSVDEVKDPYAMRQGNGTSEAFLKHSILYDHSDFIWQNDTEWKQNPERIVKNPSAGEKGVRELSIYEMHIDTLTNEGTYDAAKEKLKNIKNLGYNAIEIMPQENTFSFNWGYDGVDKFAPPDHRGGPDKLKELIDYAHGAGLNVIMDYVPNHLGPDGAQLGRTGPYIKGPNDFGDAFNFEGENSKYVRDYIVNAGMNWIDNYHVDGLRLDMTKYMQSDFTLKEIAAEIGYHFPDKFLIAEDARGGINANGYDFWEDGESLHDKRVTNPLRDDETCVHKSEDDHCRFINSIDDAIKYPNHDNTRRMIKNLGYDSEWDFSYFHALKNSLYNPDPSNLWHLVNAIYQSQHAVKYVTSHDETGNFDGTRPVVKLLVPKLNMNSNIVLTDEDYERAEAYSELKHTSLDSALMTVASQKAQLVTEKLVKLLVEGKLDKYRTSSKMTFYDEVLKPLDICEDSNITYRDLVQNYKKCSSQMRMATALTYAVPGPKMALQGEENLDITPFRFFRQFENPPVEPYLETEKGYPSGEKALNASKMGNIDYSNRQKTSMRRFSRLTSDLNRLNRENPALTKGYLTLKDNGEKNCVVLNGTIGLHSKDEETGNEFFTVVNLRDDSYPDGPYHEYKIQFPEGKWVEVLNTDSVKYGGSGKFANEEYIYGHGIVNKEQYKRPIKIASQSAIFFKRVG